MNLPKSSLCLIGARLVGAVVMVVGGLAAASGLTGCAGGGQFSPWGTTANRPSAEPTPKLASRPPKAAGPGSTIALASGENPLAGAGRMISDGLQRVSDDIGEALTIQSPTTPAPDPTRLASKPGKLGPELYVSAALLAASQENYPAAEQQLKKALAMQKDDLPALLTMSRILHRQGRLAESAHYAERAVQAHPASAVAHNDLGLSLARQGKFDAATVALRRATELDPKSHRYANNLAAALVDSHRTDEAHRQLARVQSSDVANYNLGYLLHQAGRNDEAAARLRQALAENPQLAQARQLLDALPQAQVTDQGPRVTNPGPRARVVSVTPAPAASVDQPVYRVTRPQAAPVRPMIGERVATAPPPTEDRRGDAATSDGLREAGPTIEQPRLSDPPPAYRPGSTGGGEFSYY